MRGGQRSKTEEPKSEISTEKNASETKPVTSTPREENSENKITTGATPTSMTQTENAERNSDTPTESTQEKDSTTVEDDEPQKSANADGQGDDKVGASVTSDMPDKNIPDTEKVKENENVTEETNEQIGNSIEISSDNPEQKDREIGSTMDGANSVQDELKGQEQENIVASAKTGVRFAEEDNELGNEASPLEDPSKKELNWTKTNYKKLTVRPEKDGKDQKRTVLTAEVKDSDGHEKIIRALSTPEDPAKVQPITLNKDTNDIPKGIYWLDPNNMLIYSHDTKDADGTVHKMGDKVVVTDSNDQVDSTMKQPEYYVYYPDDGGTDHFLKVVKDGIVDNKAEGLDVQMYDWGDGAQKGDGRSTQEDYLNIESHGETSVTHEGGNGAHGILYTDANGKKYFIWSSKKREEVLGKELYYLYNQANGGYAYLTNGLGSAISYMSPQNFEKNKDNPAYIFAYTTDLKDGQLAKDDQGNPMSSGITYPKELDDVHYQKNLNLQNVVFDDDTLKNSDILKDIKNASNNSIKGYIVKEGDSEKYFIETNSNLSENDIGKQLYYSTTSDNCYDVIVGTDDDRTLHRGCSVEQIQQFQSEHKPVLFVLQFKKNNYPVQEQVYTGQNGAGSGVFGTLGSELNSNGYPDIAPIWQANNNIKNISGLFDPHNFTKTNFGDKTNQKNGEKGYSSWFETNGLFQLTDEGYFEYNSNHNFASLAPNGYQKADWPEGEGRAQNGDTIPFTLFKDTGTPSSSENKFYFNNGNFFPYDTLNPNKSNSNKSGNVSGTLYETTLGGQNGNRSDYNFGMVVSGKFVQGVDGKYKGKDMIYHFSGDDDMAVYIDGKLVLDLTGIHDAMDGTINFATGEIKANGYTRNNISELASLGMLPIKNTSVTNNLGDKEFGFDDLTEVKDDEGKVIGHRFADGSVHDIKIFYMERGRGASHLEMALGMPTAPENTVTSQVTKRWNDGDNHYDTRQKDGKENTYADFTFQQRLKGETDDKWVNADWNMDEEGIQDTVRLNDANDWTAIARKLPRYDKDGHEIEYRWVENVPKESPYQTNSEKEQHDADKDEDTGKGKGNILSQVWNFVNTLFTKTTAKQEWNDANDKFKKRPDSVKMKFKYSTDDGKTYTIYDFDPNHDGIDDAVLDNANGWTTSVSLPKYDKDGNEIHYKYEWSESDSPKAGYRASSKITSDDGVLDQTYTIVNTLQAEASVVKTWDDADNQDSVRPKSIIMTLHQTDAKGKDTGVTKEVTVSPDKEGKWTASEKVDRADENGNELKYYWTEGDVPEYQQSEYQQYALGDSSIDEQTTITNKHIPKVVPEDPSTDPAEPGKDSGSEPDPNPGTDPGEPGKNPGVEPGQPTSDPSTETDSEKTPEQNPSTPDSQTETLSGSEPTTTDSQPATTDTDATTSDSTTTTLETEKPDSTPTTPDTHNPSAEESADVHEVTPAPTAETPTPAPSTETVTPAPTEAVTIKPAAAVNTAAVNTTTTATAEATKATTKVPEVSKNDATETVSTNDVQTGDAGDVSRNVAAMSFSAAGLGLWALISRRRRQRKHSR